MSLSACRSLILEQVAITCDSDVNKVTEDIILRGKLNPAVANSGLSDLVASMVMNLCKEEMRALQQDQVKLADALQWAETILLESETASTPAASSSPELVSSQSTSETTAATTETTASTTPAPLSWDQKPGSLVSR